MSSDEIHTYEYGDNDFIYRTAPWKDKDAQQLSKFDKELHRRWDKAMDAGAFRYGTDHIVTRILPGPKQYVGQLNTKRATERRAPQIITSVNQPFNPKAFNFSWVKKEEIIFNLHNVDYSKGKAALNGVITGTENGISDSSTPSQENSQDNAKDERHTLIVNVSPMEYGHCLLVPQIDCQRPQILTETAFRVAIETMLLSQHRGFRIGFNSLCAFASVNHLHFHVYYLEHELIVDFGGVSHLGGKYYEFKALPCPGFGIQLHGSSVSEMSRLAYKVSSYFHETDVAHNVYMSRGTVFGEERDSDNTTIRLFIWPRKKFIGNKSSEEFNVACIELGGHLPIKGEIFNQAAAEIAGHLNIKEEAGYHVLTEADVDGIIAEANLPPEQYASIRAQVAQFGLEEEAASMKQQS